MAKNSKKRSGSKPSLMAYSTWKRKLIDNIITNKGNEGTKEGRGLHGGAKLHLYRWNRRFHHVREKRSFSLKGQWFLISAVIASGAFLAISILFNNYFVVDTSEPALIDEDYFFSNVKSGLNRTVQLSNCTVNDGITNMDRNLKTFVQFSKQELTELGYFLHIEYTINDCAAKRVNYGILLASDRYVRCDNVANPQAVLPGVKC